MIIQAGDPVVVKRDITRAEGPYAKAGETGVVRELFRPHGTGANERKPVYAKVIIDQRIKTFRLTSLEKT